ARFTHYLSSKKDNICLSLMNLKFWLILVIPIMVTLTLVEDLMLHMEEEIVEASLLPMVEARAKGTNYVLSVD
ncbi:hypothetical protein A2U01_0062852, partial [Trifolium medium]|nr:hypothetical protein [Trifolium medium]